jgi:hypothetical protein
MYNIYGNGTYGSQAVYASLGQKFYPGDITTFESFFNLTMHSVDVYKGNTQYMPSGDSCLKNVGNCIESSLDLQYIISTSATVPTTYWYDSLADNNYMSFILNVTNEVDPAKVYSISYGGERISSNI